MDVLYDFVKELDNYPVLEDLHRATGIRKLSAIVLIGPVLLLLRFFTGSGTQAANIFCNIVGFLYPAIASIRAIETPTKLDDTRWLTYFVVLATFTLVEQLFLHRLLTIFPFYFAFKFGLLIWAQAPSCSGAVFVYSHILTPFIKNHSVKPQERIKI